MKAFIYKPFLMILISAMALPFSGITQPYHTGENAGQYFDIPSNFKKQIKQALPKQSATSPRKDRKLLIYTYLKEDAHSSVPYANYAFYQIGEETGAYTAYFSDDSTVFEPNNLNQFDALILNNTAGILFHSPKARQSLLDFVYQGKGIIGIHAGAGATFVKYPKYDQFPEFGWMMGGYENGGHPWHTWEWINLKVNEPDHPINTGFTSTDFDISDEIYQYLNLYDNDYVRVILSVNTEKTDMKDRRLLPERRLDNDFPISWVKDYGRGRVFNSSLGHHPHINWDMRILEHYMRGFQYALGDLDVPTTPTGKLNASTIAQEKTGLSLGIEAYTYKDNTFFDVIDHAKSMEIWNVGGLNVQKVSKEIDKNFDYSLSKLEMLQVREKLIKSGVNLKTYYIHDIPNNKAECNKIFEFASYMGIETLISEPKPEALELIGQYCEKFNIKVAIHNHGPRLSPIYHDPSKLLKLLEDKSKMIGVCGDTGYWTRNEFDPLESIKLLGDRLFTIQLHDLNQLNAEGHDVPWGTGKSNVSEIIRLLPRDLTMVGLEYSYKFGDANPEIIESKEFFNHIIVRIAAQSQNND